jgi:hypothetical protein
MALKNIFIEFEILTVHYGYCEMLNDKFIRFISEFGSRVKLHICIDALSYNNCILFNENKQQDAYEIIKKYFSVEPNQLLFTNRLGLNYILLKKPEIDLIISETREESTFTNSKGRIINIYDPVQKDFYEKILEEVLLNKLK